MRIRHLSSAYNNYLGNESVIKEDIDAIEYDKESDKNHLLGCSDEDSNFTSISQIGVPKRKQVYNTQSNDYLVRCDESKSNELVSNQSTIESNSNGSFLDKTRLNRKNKFLSPQEENLRKSTPFRLFDRRGKPLTDRTGRTLVDIFGEPLVLFDDEGRMISDSKGNQIFNCVGESSIHSNTDLHISPASLEEPGIPVMDFHKKHVLNLFDCKGHPMTDSLGRPLLKASGKRMFGMDSGDIININDFKENKLSSMYGKSPLENIVRYIQIFNAELEPLTNASGVPNDQRRIICNKDGMPICDDIGRPLYFNYGDKVFSPQEKSSTISSQKHNVSSEEDLTRLNSDSKMKICQRTEYSKAQASFGGKINTYTLGKLSTINEGERFQVDSHNEATPVRDPNCGKQPIRNDTNPGKSTDGHLPHRNEVLVPQKVNISSNTADLSTQCARANNSKGSSLFNSASENTNEAIVIFDASKKFEKKQSSSITKVSFNNVEKKVGGCNTRDFTKRLHAPNMFECLKNSFNLSAILKPATQTPRYNHYGKPTQDRYGNALYDKFGIPLTGAHGIRISEKARNVLRVKLRNISPKLQSNVICYANENRDDYGETCYDKYGRPLYDLFGSLMYDLYGRPLTDAFGRPLIDAIGQPLMDSKGNILTSMTSTDYTDQNLTDIFGRPLHDKYGRPLFDTYGRPRFDIFTNAIYDSCGRPATDGNGEVRFDFLKRPIQPQPAKPLHKNARASLPKFIEKILEIPSMHRVFKFSHTSLQDVFGGPLFDDYGRPLYNKKGKPLYDKYGRPLYDREGKPLCDCYGRPLSEEIRESSDDETASVMDSLKLLKLTNESSQWMEIRRSEMSGLRPSSKKIMDDGMKVFKPRGDKSTRYVYALARVTTFSCGRHAIEILEAPLSSSTAAIMHRLPIDNKPVVIVARKQCRIERVPNKLK